MRTAVDDDLVQAELQVQQQLSAALPADIVAYQSTRPPAASRRTLVADMDAVIASVCSMGGRIVIASDRGAMMEASGSSSASNASRKREHDTPIEAAPSKRVATGMIAQHPRSTAIGTQWDHGCLFLRGACVLPLLRRVRVGWLHTCDYETNGWCNFVSKGRPWFPWLSTQSCAVKNARRHQVRLHVSLACSHTYGRFFQQTDFTFESLTCIPLSDLRSS